MISTDVPYTFSVDSAVLHTVLESVLSDYAGRPQAIKHMVRRICPYSSSFVIEELEVTLEDEVRLPVVFKDVSPGITEDEKRWIKPSFLYHPRREIDVYRSLLAQAHLGTATCYGAVATPSMKRYWLFLERVPGVPLWQVGDFEQWEAAARWLAVMHTRLHRQRTRVNQRVGATWLRYDEAYYRRWMQRIVRIARQTSPSAMDVLDRLFASEDRLIKQLLMLPTTFIHGEFYPSNVLVQQQEDGLRICPVDWEMAAIGPGLMDLGALTSGDWIPEQQSAMAAAYRDVLVDAYGSFMGMDELTENLNWCRLFQALTWLGWSMHWTPPKEHARDWFQEVVVLAERLSL